MGSGARGRGRGWKDGVSSGSCCRRALHRYEEEGNHMAGRLLPSYERNKKGTGPVAWRWLVCFTRILVIGDGKGFRALSVGIGEI